MDPETRNFYWVQHNKDIRHLSFQQYHTDKQNRDKLLTLPAQYTHQQTRQKADHIEQF